MNNKDIIRAWKDKQYRLSLSEAEKALLPENPAGLIELGIEELSNVAGGMVKPSPSSYDFSCSRPDTICPNTPKGCYPRLF